MVNLNRNSINFNNLVNDLIQDKDGWKRTYYKQYLTWARIDLSTKRAYVWDCQKNISGEEIELPIDTLLSRFSLTDGSSIQDSSIALKGNQWFQVKYKGIRDAWNNAFTAHRCTQKYTGISGAKTGDFFVYHPLQGVMVVNGKYFPYYFGINGFHVIQFNTEVELPKPPDKVVYYKPEQEPDEIKVEFERGRSNIEAHINNQNIKLQQSYEEPDWHEQIRNMQKQKKVQQKEAKIKHRRNKAQQIPFIGRFLMGFMDFLDIFRSFARGE